MTAPIPGFWRWLLFWVTVPLAWMLKRGQYWTIGNSGYLYFKDFKKAVLGDD